MFFLCRQLNAAANEVPTQKDKDQDVFEWRNPPANPFSQKPNQPETR